MSQLGNMYLTNVNHEDLVVLKEFIDAGKLKPIIDKTYPLSDAPEAFQHMQENHAQGKIVLTMA